MGGSETKRGGSWRSLEVREMKRGVDGNHEGWERWIGEGGGEMDHEGWERWKGEGGGEMETMRGGRNVDHKLCTLSIIELT